jgi:nitrile hydratase
MNFRTGDAVRVKDDWPEARGRVHLRTPHYLRGVQGHVVRHLGDFPNPEDLAFARPAQRLPLYHVRFDRNTIWPDHPAPVPPTNDELLVEIYGHWLEQP